MYYLGIRISIILNVIDNDALSKMGHDETTPCGFYADVSALNQPIFLPIYCTCSLFSLYLYNVVVFVMIYNTYLLLKINAPELILYDGPYILSRNFAMSGKKFDKQVFCGCAMTHAKID